VCHRRSASSRLAPCLAMAMPIIETCDGQVQKSEMCVPPSPAESTCASSAPGSDREWGADCGVGATALWIAYIRHCERQREQPAFEDPFAQRFLGDGKGEEVATSMARVLHHFMFMNASGTDFHSTLTLRYALPFLGRRYLQRMRHAPVPPQEVQPAGHDPLAKGVRIRTAYFDDRIRAVVSGSSQVRQFVTLASGVDCRCLRLECLQQSGVRTWLVDQPAVIAAFRNRLPELDARSDIQTLAVKFGEELWWEKLVAAGFDPSMPSLFLVEGLVMYLGEAEVKEIFQEIYRLMAPGSVVMGDYVNKGFLHHPMVEPFNEELRKYSAPWTYGARNSQAWAQMLTECGFAMREDAPSVELRSLGTRVKFFLIDAIGTWVPTYRTYLAVKEAQPRAAGVLAVAGGLQKWGGQPRRPCAGAACALTLALLAAFARPGLRKKAWFVGALLTLLRSLTHGTRGAHEASLR